MQPLTLAVPDFKVLFEATPGLYLVLTPDLIIVAVSDAYLQATMTERDAIVGRYIFDVFPDNPADAGATGVSNLRASLSRVTRDCRADTMAVQKYDIRRPDGTVFEERYWSPVNSPVRRRDGSLAFIIHAVEDVTDFIRLRDTEHEQAMRTAELETRAGRMEAEIVRRAQELQQANEQLRTLHADLESRVAARTADLRIAHDDLEKSELQRRQLQKLEAVGRLAGGIAHDFNNLLSVILSCTEFLIEHPGLDPSCRKEVDQIHHAGRRAADLTRQMLAFSRQQVLEPKVLDLNDTLMRLSRMLERVLGEDIDLKTFLAPELGLIKADPGQVEQVIMNLVVNARDAMPRGGKLTLSTANVELDEVYARDHLGVTPGPYVMVSVSDTGIGMDEATQLRIFEPFFTTKEQGKGTGLGLATVFGIVKQSGGNLWVYSEPGIGTTFRVYLPRAMDSEFASRPTPASGVARGHETILLVEDQDQVRGVATRILEGAGYTVLATHDPREALLVLQHHERSIDLLLTDVVMPAMSGRQLAETVARLRPGTRILFMSGYTDDAILHHGVLDSGFAFLQKPLTPDSLSRKVREVLDSRTSETA